MHPSLIRQSAKPIIPRPICLQFVTESRCSWSGCINPSGRPGSGGNIGKQVEEWVNTGIGRSGVHIDLSKALELKGIDKAVADQIVASFDKNINSSKIKWKSFDAKFIERLGKGKNKGYSRQLDSIRITGIDEDGKEISTLSKYNKKTQEFSTTITNVKQRFNDVTKSASSSNKEFSKLTASIREIGNQKIKIAGLDPKENAKELAAAEARLRELEKYRNKIASSFNGNFTQDQLDEMRRLNRDNKARYQIATGKALDKTQSDVDEITLKLGIDDNSTKEIDKTISRLKSQVKDIDVKFNTDTSGIKDEIGRLETMKQEMLSLQQSGDQDGLIKKYEEYERLLARISNEISIISNTNKKSISELDKVSLGNKMTQWLEKNSKASKEFGGQINVLQQRLAGLEIDSDNAAQELAEISEEFKKIQQNAIKAGKVGKSFGDKLKKALGGLAGLFTFDAIFDRVIDGLRDMYQQVYDIDSAMVSLKKVTDETAERYERFLSDSAASAKQLGRSISSLIEQTATWTKLGYTLDESEGLAKLSSIYANVAEVDNETAVSDMVTAMKAFGIEAKDAITVIDPLNELGNKFATDAASLGNALTRSASAMNAAGTDMYKTLAMITGGAEITQNASEFGNFMKVASMRLRGMKGELEELGEEVDESVDSISKVQTQILNLTQGKINIFDDAGNFRDYYDIMKEIAAIYDELSSTDQAALTEILFGKMRGNQGQALLQAFQSGQVEKAYQTAINSAGSAMAEQEKWMESLEAKTQQFQAAWQELSTTVLNSNFLKGLVDTGSDLVNIFSSLIGAPALLTSVSTIIGGIIAFTKSLD